MGDKTSIEWTDATWNPTRGCSRVSPGCGGPNHEGGCYAERVAARFSAPSGGSLAILNGYRSRAMDRDGNVPPGDPATEEGCSQILEAVDRGGYTFMSHLGKKRAGALLDGREHREMPQRS